MHTLCRPVFIRRGGRRPEDLRDRRHRRRVASAVHCSAVLSIEDALAQTFFGKKIDRVLKSVRRTMSASPDFERRHPGLGLQQAHSYIEGAQAYILIFLFFFRYVFW